DYMDYLKDGIKIIIKLQNAFKAENYTDAFNYCLTLANSDYPARYEFQGLLAVMYSEGLGCSKNVDKAIYWFRKAIKEGSPSAGYNLFIQLLYGNSFDIDDDELLEALSSSANRGYVPAYSTLGVMLGIDGKTQEEGYWYKKSAESNDIIGMLDYGCYLSAVKHDKQNALYWLKKAYNDNRLESVLENNSLKTDGMRTKQDIETLIYKVEHDQPVLSPSAIYGEGTNSTHVSNNNTHVTPSQPTVTQPTVTTNSSGNSYYSKKRHYHKPFNCPEDDYYLAGLSVGYVQKQWTYKSDGEKGKFGYWDDSKCICGLQAGIRVEPLFKYGFGLDTGLYYEFYYSKSDPLTEYGETYSPSLVEHALYLPVHLEYRANISKLFQIFIYGGIGLDFGISAKLKTNNDYLEYDDDNAYDDYWKRFNASLEYGGGIRIDRFQVDFTLSNGLINMSKDSDIKVKQNKNIMCTLSVMM
ncbi:MAG: outer membrane beta-barrel protein, partial [Prevotella sp.]|nr:outer membrane beta-barrel protein [Prevotella sp.]